MCASHTRPKNPYPPSFHVALMAGAPSAVVVSIVSSSCFEYRGSKRMPMAAKYLPTPTVVFVGSLNLIPTTKEKTTKQNHSAKPSNKTTKKTTQQRIRVLNGEQRLGVRSPTQLHGSRCLLAVLTVYCSGELPCHKVLPIADVSGNDVLTRRVENSTPRNVAQL